MDRGVSSFDQLTVDERIRLVQDLWDEIASVPEQVDITAAQRDELDRRVEEHRASPGECIDWAVARARILSR